MSVKYLVSHSVLLFHVVSSTSKVIIFSEWSTLVGFWYVRLLLNLKYYKSVVVFIDYDDWHNEVHLISTDLQFS
jgi:hypothetical protein